MSGKGHAEALAADLQRFFSTQNAQDHLGLSVLRIRPFPQGCEVIVTDGNDRATIVLFDSGAILIENDVTRLNYRLKKWEATILRSR